MMSKVVDVWKETWDYLQGLKELIEEVKEGLEDLEKKLEEIAT